jgi:ABC-type branched-subunit amino acid transport system permease subunit
MSHTDNVKTAWSIAVVEPALISAAVTSGINVVLIGANPWATLVLSAVIGGVCGPIALSKNKRLVDTKGDFGMLFIPLLMVPVGGLASVISTICTAVFLL